MPRSAMVRDGSKPANVFPPSFGPGGGVVEGHIWMDRDNVCWQVLGYQLEPSRLFVKNGRCSAWLAMTFPPRDSLA